ncbi:MAG: precorrin-6y C5,15-methyltransferase (decarboxylating) subunit CbiE [Limnospira sp.]
MTIHVVGIGLDGAAGLRESARQIIDRAELLVGSDRHLSYFGDRAIPQLILNNLTEGLSELRQWLTRREREMPTDPNVVVLVSGDPLFFGLGRLLLAEFPPEKMVFHPHLSSIQLAFNRIKVPWQDARIISAHGRSLDHLIQALQQGEDKIAVLTDNLNTPPVIGNLISSLDLPSSYQFWVCERLNGEGERVQKWALEDLDSHSFSLLSVVVLLRELPDRAQPLNLSDLPLFGIPDRLFLSYSDRPGLMTKREVRMLVLGELGLQGDRVIWDIGAGTGSVSVEIARMCPTSTVYAIEKTAAGTSLIEQNCRHFQVNNVISIHGEAPAILNHLRSPDRIFIGGSGGNLAEILGTCSIRLAPGGTMVLALATLEHLNVALEWVKERVKLEKSWSYRLLQVQLSRSTAIADLTRFSPLNPVTILTIHHHSLFA